MRDSYLSRTSKGTGQLPPMTSSVVKLMQLGHLFLKGPSLINVSGGYFETNSITQTLENT